MTTLQGLLPEPRHNYEILPEFISPSQQALQNAQKVYIPPYLSRNNYVPRKLSDFGDGGAFPEIHVAQYPLDMGNPSKKASSTAIVAVQIGEDGKPKYDAIVKQGSNKNKTVFTSINDLKEKEGNKNTLQRPSEEEEEKTTAETRLALERIISGKIAAARPVQVAKAKNDEPSYIRYTPDQNAPGFNPSAKQRIVRLVEEQIDPMEPPKHRHKKVPGGPSSPPVPILHSPPRKLTVKDQQAWKIPPCISNWKNAKGYTIPLDKRLAADGRGLQELKINNNLATFTEALYIAERKAREEVRLNNQRDKMIAMTEKERKEKELREIAKNARMERAGLITGKQGQHEDESDEEIDQRTNSRDEVDRYANKNEESDRSQRRREERTERSYTSRDHDDYRERTSEKTEDQRELEQREKARIEKKKERERELRLQNMKGNFKKAKLEKERERDIGEKIALGLHVGTRRLSGESQFDNRLFNQSAGLDAGFGHEEDYTVYSKPLFDRGEAASIYRPKKTDEFSGNQDEVYNRLANTERFKPDKGFKGADDIAPREGPVQFEREELDPFGLDQFLSEAKKGKKKK